MAVRCPKCDFNNTPDSKYCKECGTRIRGHVPDSPESGTCPQNSRRGPEPNSPEFGIVPPGSKTETLLTPVQKLTTGSTFAGRYQVIEELGKGGMGKVYKVFDSKIKEKVALKLIRPDIASDTDTIERFSNELRLSRRISHRNICRMFDLGEAEGAHFITMEYVSGEDLKSLIRRVKQLTTGTAISIARQACEGLAEAHRLGIVHRDLKPGNIMIDQDGNARIMDFGIARSLYGKGITGAGVMIGTPEYMSPEQVEGRDVDQRSDLYSLGIIIYEMLTGRVPFEGDTPFTVGVKHKSETPRSPKEFNPGIPDDLSGVILKCLEKDQAKRYESASDLRAELERIEKGLPTTERFVPERKPLTSRQITVQFSLKKLFLPALTALIVIAAAVVFWKVLPHKKSPPAPSGKPSLAILYFENISADPGLDDWKTGLTELLITDLSQSKYINVLESDRIYSLLKRLGLDQAKKYTSEDLIKIAEEGRVTYTGTGSIMKAGESIIITFALRNLQTGESIPPHKLECKGEAEIASKVDELTRLIKADINLSSVQISTDLDQSLGKITTSSPEAYRFFVEGAKLNSQGDFAQCIESLRKAVALDPEFAMAWRSMAVAYANMGNSADFEKYIRKALEFSDRVSEREFLEIQGLAEKNAAKRIEIFNKLIELYPENPWGHQRLGSTYIALEEWDRAQKHLEWGYRADKENPILVSNLSELYLAKGMYDRAKVILGEYLGTHPDNPFLRYGFGLTYLCVGEWDRAITEADRAYVLSPTDPSSIFLRGDIFLCMGELKKAEEEYRRLLKPEETLTSIFGWQRLSYLDSLQGKFGQSVRDLDQALKFAQRVETKYDEVAIRNCLSYTKMTMGRLTESLEEADAAQKVAEGLGSTETSYLQFIRHWTLWPLLMRGLCHVQMNSLEKASRIAEEIQTLDLYRAERRWHLYLVGLIELKKKNNAKAIEFLKEALALEPYQWAPEATSSAFFLEALARAYFESGDLENARKRYEEITRLTTGQIRYGDIYARSFYMLGKIGERQGGNVRAREDYQKFLDLWKAADPGIPEVEDAWKRLAGLKESQSP